MAHVQASLAATTGVHSAVEAIKYLMAGADVVMTTSALLQQGPQLLARILSDMTSWMERKGYSSAFVRANYIKTLESYRPLRRS